MTPGLKTTEELTEELGITKWHAMSGGIHVHSAIINIRRWDDRRRVKRVYIYFDYSINNYVMEGASR